MWQENEEGVNMAENEKLEKQIADDLSAVLKEAKEMGCKEVAYFRHIPLQNVETVVNTLYEIQQYRKSLKNKHIGKDNMVISSSDLMTILNSDEKEIRNKAIDEFVKEIEAEYDNDGCPNVTDYLDYKISIRDLHKIADQLKEGAV